MKLNIGDVLRLWVEDTNPPKYKFIVIVGFEQNRIAVASLFINSRVNQRINWNPYLEALHIEISATQHHFLSYNSYVDCSELHIDDVVRLTSIIESNPDIICGTIHPTILSEIRNRVIHADTIKAKIKKKFGFFD